MEKEKRRKWQEGKAGGLKAKLMEGGGKARLRKSGTKDEERNEMRNQGNSYLRNWFQRNS